MRASTEKVQTEIGMGTPFVKLPFEKFGTFTNQKLLKIMWKNLGSLEKELLWRDLPSLPLQREGDTYIMADFSSLYDMYKRTISRLKQVRLSMKIYAMSDLTTGNSLSIQQDMVVVCTPGTEEQNQYEWPQEQSTADDRRIWAERLQEITSANFCLMR